MRCYLGFLPLNPRSSTPTALQRESQFCVYVGYGQSELRNVTVGADISVPEGVITEVTRWAPRTMPDGTEFLDQGLGLEDLEKVALLYQRLYLQYRHGVTRATLRSLNFGRAHRARCI